MSTEETPPPAPAGEGKEVPPPTPPETPPGDEQNEPLGEGGKRALDAERDRRRAAIEELGSVKAELDELRKQSMSDTEKAIDEARAQGEQAAEQRWRDRLAQSEVKSSAVGKFAAPDVVIHLIDEVPFTTDGSIDQPALTAKLDALLTARPELGLAPAVTPPAGMAPGARGGGTLPTADDVKRMSSAEVAAKFASGELNHLTAST